MSQPSGLSDRVHEPNHQQRHQDPWPVWGKPFEPIRQFFRKDPGQHLKAVQRRKGDEIEDAQEDVQADNEVEKEIDEVFAVAEADDRLDVRAKLRFHQAGPNRKRRDCGEKKVRGRACERDDCISSAWPIFEPPRVDRRRFCPAKAKQK